MALGLRPSASLLSIVAIIVVSGVGAFAPPSSRLSPPPAARSVAAASPPRSSSPDRQDDVRDAATAVPPPLPSVVSRRSAVLSGLASAAAAAATTMAAPASPFLLALATPLPAYARLEGVNRPELLPSEPGLNVIQLEKFLTRGQEKRMDDLLAGLERDTGWRVRVLCQAYPRTPG